RAARDLLQADVERAVSARQILTLAGIAGGLFFVLVILLLRMQGQFVSLLQRAFVPFDKVAIATRTEITLRQPQHGDVTVPGRENVPFRVEVRGRVPGVNQPDSARLHYRYRQSDPYIVRLLEQDVDGEWIRTLVADEVQNGFWYKITAGDAETAEYQVKVQ